MAGTLLATVMIPAKRPWTTLKIEPLRFGERMEFGVQIQFQKLLRIKLWCVLVPQTIPASAPVHTNQSVVRFT